MTNHRARERILVTGGAGYIGSHTCKALSQAGYLPVTYDNLISGHDWAVKWGPLEPGDILDRDRLLDVMTAHKPIAVLHFAAYAYVGESLKAPGKYYRNNVVGTLTLLEAMRERMIDKIVFSSTCATYGVPDRLPISEKIRQQPINPYGASKLMVERMLADFDLAHGLRSIALRYFNAAGADPDGEIGEFHDPETHLIPIVLDAASGRREAVTIYGTDYDTPDGTCIRDFIHVSDLADAHVLALKSILNGAPSCAYNLGNGCGSSIREVIQAAERITGLSVPVTHGDRREGDPPMLVSDARTARLELGWQPQFPELEVMVRHAWAWHQRAANFYAVRNDRSQTAGQLTRAL
jgi:UDP-arabinose 4-epimerase